MSYFYKVISFTEDFIFPPIVEETFAKGYCDLPKITKALDLAEHVYREKQVKIDSEVIKFLCIILST